MYTRRMCPILQFATYVLILCTHESTIAQTSTAEQEVLRRLDQIRAIQVTSDAQLLREYNEQLDDVWTYLKTNKELTMPILADQLRLEREKDDPNDFLLLDVGYFLYMEGNEEEQYNEEAKRALYSLDPLDDVVMANQQQLFYFIHGVASERDHQVLSLIDKAFLRGGETQVFVPQHSLTLDATLICVFLYGVYGQGSEEHLMQLMDDSLIVNRVVEILIWIGTDRSVDVVEQAMMMHRNYGTFSRALAFMMQAGGPSGREVMLKVDLQDHDEDSQQYFDKVKKAIRDISYDAMKSQFDGLPGDTELPDDEVKSRLARMYENFGKDDETNPMSILNSNLPKEFLIRRLCDIRARTFHRISDEALSDVKVTTSLINTLQYRAN